MTKKEFSRRDFIKYNSYGMGAVGLLHACKNNPLNPFLQNRNPQGKREDYLFFATTCQNCPAACPMIVKTYQGKAIKAEGNPLSIYSAGGLCAAAHAGIASSYDRTKPLAPQIHGNSYDWTEFDRQVIKKLKEIKKNRKRKILLTKSIHGPSAREIIQKFCDQYQFQHIQFDIVSSHALQDAHQRLMGKRVTPNYLFAKANIIVLFNANPLTTWISPVYFSKQISRGRLIDEKRDSSYILHFGNHITADAMYADQRIAIKAAEEKDILIYMYQKIRGIKTELQIHKQVQAALDKLIPALLREKGKSIIISASHNQNIQQMVLGLNALLNNYGRSIDIDNPLQINQDNDNETQDFLNDLISGNIEALIQMDTDILSWLPDAEKYGKEIAKSSFSLIHNSFPSDFSKYYQHQCFSEHYLESFDDHEPLTGCYSISQPVMKSDPYCRSYRSSLLRWMEKTETDDQYIKKFWENKLKQEKSSIHGWEELAAKGVWHSSKNKTQFYNNTYFLEPAIQKLKEEENRKLNLVLRDDIRTPKNAMHTDAYLMEMTEIPGANDLENPAFINPVTARDLQLQHGDLAGIESCDITIRAHIFIHPAMPPDCISVSLRTDNRSLALMHSRGKFRQDMYPVEKVHIIHKKNRRKSLKSHQIFTKQYKLEDFLILAAGNATKTQEKNFHTHHWAMAIDLNLCTACQACVISCQCENNIPLVGSSEKARNRSMHWLRIENQYHESEDFFEYFPMMCQHCDKAPCEPVCPVAATSSSTEGINQQNYQRCIGTRFCSANCPYGTRQFNYADYGENLQFRNPEVHIRERGVIEKCSFCIQKIVDAKNRARINDKPIQDGQIQTACQQSCPAGAIVFGDLNDKGSRIYQMLHNKRAFQILEVLNTKSSVYYLAKVKKEI
jgi:Fe-S-cluster-containing dehydrogenase component